ncbi:hypothetical protein PFICI_08135 [Pestalotiopsis fici W106-1]|uniref:RBR-type E3 ubiquitin transferase n=1 Tax=Pestalotiopsis fici (strain W106-1 / CGMCC3.15140) TaxID=1229662 RepID=W3X607_PESFW|nr:uncharacterized protein PFICI_08135 [Pestalotiopsis fici W106-1]ETS80606.1 hypothetical protein PFICI_08135 [Pestalotiopsis fici W106-1]
MKLLKKQRKPDLAYEQVQAEKRTVEARLDEVERALAAEQDDHRNDIRNLLTKFNELSVACAVERDEQNREIEALSAKFDQLVRARAIEEDNQRDRNSNLSAARLTEDQWWLIGAGPGPSATNPFEMQETDRYLFTAASSDTAPDLRPPTPRPPTPRPYGPGFPQKRDTDIGRSGPLQECNVCVETKPITAFPVLSISNQCEHIPQTCYSCIATSIKTQFGSKIWNQIHCPECHGLMDYHDVERQADEETFAKYQALSVQETANAIPGFVWCPTGCGFGQVQANASMNPIVQCGGCNYVFCFRHRVKWHDGLGCEEYDEMRANPDGFRSHLEILNEEAENQNRREAALKQEQEEADRRFAQSLVDDEEEMHRAEQLAAEERRQRESREVAEEARRQAEREAARQEAEQRNREAAIRKQQENAGERLVRSTTKPCPSCKWHIEKNEGCDHMTCRLIIFFLSIPLAPLCLDFLRSMKILWCTFPLLVHHPTYTEATLAPEFQVSNVVLSFAGYVCIHGIAMAALAEDSSADMST